MKKNVLYILITTLIASFVFFILLKPVVEYPNSFLFSKSGDAVKSYYNFAYYLKYDSGFKHDGINYPYGDHLQYINSHPLYVQVLKFIDNYIYPISDYGVGIMNLTMIFALLLTIPFLFLILRKFNLPRWYSAVITLIILFLSPQFDRIHGHFEMVYAFFIPMYWYFLIRWKENKNKRLWSALLLVTALIGGFTSAYFVAFYAILLIGVLLVDLWFNRKHLKNYWKEGVSLLILAILPLLIVKGFVSITDWATDRPTNPYGFFVYNANFYSVFLPFVSPLKNAFGEFINMNFQWEGRAFVGLPSTLLFLSMIIAIIYNLTVKNKLKWRIYSPPAKFQPFFWASVLILLFSMAIPFKYGFSFLLELLPPVKQFRALGRFTWIFYYVFTIYTAWFLFRLLQFLKLKNLKFLGFVIMFFALSSWVIDVGNNIKRSTANLIFENDILESDSESFINQLKAANINTEAYQSIYFLPFANTSGDKFLFERGLYAFTKAMKCSYHTKLPLIQSFSPRLPFSNALSSIQLLSHPAIKKTRLNDMNEKPILLLCTDEELNEEESWLVNKANLLGEIDDVKYYHLPLSVFHKSHNDWVKKASENKKMASLNFQSSNVIYSNFDSEKSEYTFSGKGAKSIKKGEVTVYEKMIDENFKSGDYELSFWLKFDTREYNMPSAEVLIFDEKERQSQTVKLNTREEHNVYKGWVRVDQIINVQPKTKIIVKAKGRYVTIDDFLIKPVGLDVFIEKKDEFSLYNNYPLH